MYLQDIFAKNRESKFSKFSHCDKGCVFVCHTIIKARSQKEAVIEVNLESTDIYDWLYSWFGKPSTYFFPENSLEEIQCLVSGEPTIAYGWVMTHIRLIQSLAWITQFTSFFSE